MATLPKTYAEAGAVPIIVQWIDKVAHLLTTDAARMMLRDNIRDMLRENRAIPRMRIAPYIRAADQSRLARQALDMQLRAEREQILSSAPTPLDKTAAN